jgi:hypothetical protein
MRICEMALTRGVFAQAIRPPTVPDMTSRLRLAVMASHREEELRAAARTLGGIARSLGLQPDTMAAAARPQELEEAAPAARLAGESAWAPSASAPPPRAGVFDFEASEPVRRAA